MNSLSASTVPLPPCTGPDCDLPHRRHLIGGLDVSPAAIARFNGFLGELGHSEPLDRDRLVTAARSLGRMESSAGIPVCIRQRLWRVRAAVSMAADRRWDAPRDVVAVVRLVAAYVSSNDDLIPDQVPTVGRFDDAIAVDAAWPTVGGEVLDYLDFRRLRRSAARDRREWLGFDRVRWLRAREEEQQLEVHLRQVRSASYITAPGGLFRVH